MISKKSTFSHTYWPTAVLALAIASCTTKQPDFECAAQNHNVYQVRYYQQSSTCGDAGSDFLTGALSGASAGMDTYVRITPDGGGGPQVVFRDVEGKLDRSATPLVLRLGNLLTYTVEQACDNDITNNCAAPDKDFNPAPCANCVNISGDGGPGTTYALSDGTNAEDTPAPDGTKRGISRPLGDGGTKRISLSNKCEPRKKDNVARKADATPDPNLFLMLPRFGVNDVCSPLDAGSVSSKTVFPEVTCKDGTVLPKAEITTTISNFKLVSSGRIQGNLAKASISFNETRGTDKCESVYKTVLLNPQLGCSTDLDCSPDPVPNAPDCGKSPKPEDYCLSGRAATTFGGSGLSPFLFGKTSDGGFDLNNVCDREIGICIWDSDAGI